MDYLLLLTNVRTYGSDVDTVIDYAKEYIRAADECGVATSIKHFPGDGVDERDQHLLTSVNSLTMEEWDETFGRVYSELIEAGTLTVMAGHIAMPAYQAYFDGEEKKECSRCDYSTSRAVSATGHSMGDWIIDEEAGEGTEGSKHRDCANCDYTETEESKIAINVSSNQYVLKWKADSITEIILKPMKRAISLTDVTPEESFL